MQDNPYDKDVCEETCAGRESSEKQKKIIVIDFYTVCNACCLGDVTGLASIYDSVAQDVMA